MASSSKSISLDDIDWEYLKVNFKVESPSQQIQKLIQSHKDLKDMIKNIKEGGKSGS